MRPPFALLLLSIFSAQLMACGGSSSGDDNTTPAEGIFGDLGTVLPSATEEQQATFERGLRVLERRFTPAQGLGPHFNVTFCGACHEKPVFGGSAARYRNFLLVGQSLSGDDFIPLGVQSVQPQYHIDDVRQATPVSTNVTALRNPIPFFGAGLLAEIPEEEILKYADPDDADGDGIRGRPNYDRGFVGRFGRKAQTVSIEGFIRGPLFNHMGITTDPLSESQKANLPVPSTDTLTAGLRSPIRTGDAGDTIRGLVMGQAAAPDEPTTDADGVADPELSNDDLFDLVSFAMLTAAPTPQTPGIGADHGQALFDEMGCADCHVPSLQGPRGAIPAYTDLLLHDMGADMSDGVVQGLAGGQDFRTAPLWGVTATGPYLHDGRADTLREAIVAHGGEAEAARVAFTNASPSFQEDLIGFLDTLGGASQRTSGLLAPGATVPSPGQYGAPNDGLDTDTAAAFANGRAQFDRDMALSDGLGASIPGTTGTDRHFNGDACRACHFEPVIGGAGPLGVDVIRQGTVSSGTFTAPTDGTMLHRFRTEATRPEPASGVNTLQARQTPPLFGLGLLEQVSESEILSRADPTDSNMDGISGREHRLGDGRLGRFGWKADVPTLQEFARDALFNEMGITLPTEAGQTFGATTDNDSIGDPEMALEDLQNLVTFMAQLAPAPRTRTDVALEDQGEALFASVGCDGCHVPALPLQGGGTAQAYTDLLLHDVASPGAPGIESGDAAMTEFRTAPLWGLATSAPYMHNGRAETVSDAIEAHQGEAQTARDAALALSPSDQSALHAFLQSL